MDTTPGFRIRKFSTQTMYNLFLGGESDGESSQSFETSDGSTPVVLRRHDRKPSAGSDESGGSGSSANLFKVNLLH